MPNSTTTCRIVAIAAIVFSGRDSAAQQEPAPPKIPSVALSKQHQSLCKLKVGDTMPAFELQELGGNQPRSLAELAGDKATLLVFWKADRRMAREQLADLRYDVVEPFGERGVAVVGIAVEQSAADTEKTLQGAGAKFPNLLDPDGEAFARVGNEKLPRTYLLDPDGKILWFDIEYSHATRRELNQALQALTSEQ
jgi:peroxiredoxin